jgi:hypothetical protein
LLLPHPPKCALIELTETKFDAFTQQKPTKVRLIEGMAHGKMIEIPKPKETIRISKLTTPNKSGVRPSR